jgi:hypothetical protein
MSPSPVSKREYIQAVSKCYGLDDGLAEDGDE